MTGAHEEAGDARCGADEGSTVDRLRAGADASADDLGGLDRGHEPGGMAEKQRLDGCRVRLDAEERGAECADAVRRGDAEERRRHLAGVDGRGLLGGRCGAVDRVDDVLLEHVARRGAVIEAQVEGHTICRHDRSPPARIVDEPRRPRSGRHQDRVGIDLRPVLEGRADGAIARCGDSTRRPDQEVSPTLLGEVGPGLGRGRGRNREARRHGDGPQPLDQRRLGPGDLLRIEQSRIQLGEGIGHASRLAGCRVAISVEEEQSGGGSADREVAAGIGQCPVARQALAMQRGEDGVERVLDDTEVPSRSAGADGDALHEDDPGAPVGHDRGRRASDDPAAEHDDICGEAGGGVHAREDIGLSSFGWPRAS